MRHLHGSATWCMQPEQRSALQAANKGLQACSTTSKTGIRRREAPPQLLLHCVMQPEQQVTRKPLEEADRHLQAYSIAQRLLSNSGKKERWLLPCILDLLYLDLSRKAELALRQDCEVLIAGLKLRALVFTICCTHCALKSA